jgi:hypothetical protein
LLPHVTSEPLPDDEPIYRFLLGRKDRTFKGMTVTVVVPLMTVCGYVAVSEVLPTLMPVTTPRVAATFETDAFAMLARNSLFRPSLVPRRRASHARYVRTGVVDGDRSRLA